MMKSSMPWSDHGNRFIEESGGEKLLLEPDKVVPVFTEMSTPVLAENVRKADMTILKGHCVTIQVDGHED